MRNDARPIGHDVPHSPLQNPDSDPEALEGSHVVNRDADDARRDDVNVDPAMPTDDSTLKTKI